MKAIDLTKILKPYKVVAHAKNFQGISAKIKKPRDKDVLLIPASSNYFGF